jgi:hypothetical protein
MWHKMRLGLLLAVVVLYATGARPSGPEDEQLKQWHAQDVAVFRVGAVILLALAVSACFIFLPKALLRLQHRLMTQARLRPKTVKRRSSRSSEADDILFYYKVKDEEKGPYTLKQLTSMWDYGQITADALHRTSDSSEWLPLLERFAEGQPLGQPRTDSALGEGKRMAAQTGSAQMETQKELASNAKNWGVGFAGIVVLLIIIGAVFGPSHSSDNSAPSPGLSTSHKSARQVIQDWAAARHGRDANVSIDSGFYGGAYQVTVRAQIHGGIYDGGYDRYTYTVYVDESAQSVTSAQLVEHN